MEKTGECLRKKERKYGKNGESVLKKERKYEKGRKCDKEREKEYKNGESVVKKERKYGKTLEKAWCRERNCYAASSSFSLVEYDDLGRSTKTLLLLPGQVYTRTHTDTHREN